MKQPIYIGTSGFSYAHWHGLFYPADLKTKDQFSYYLQHFKSVEVNSTFYAMPKPQTFINWKNNTPDDFVFVLKANGYITHVKRLHDTSESVELFIGNAKLLGHKLGAILFQLPPGLKYDIELLKSFIKILPASFRYAFEFRNHSWYERSVYKLLEKHNCAFCIYDLARHQSPVQVTADFVYLRLHGPGRKYQGSYTDQAVMEWALQIKEWAMTKDVFVYFDNDQLAYAAFNAMKLEEILFDNKWDRD